MVGKPGYFWDTYTTTYLLAWTVVNSTAINSSTSTSARGLEIQTFYKNATVMEHADLICAKQLHCFEQNIFVGINYNFPKLDKTLCQSLLWQPWKTGECSPFKLMSSSMLKQYETNILSEKITPWLKGW